ncbi:hypothetical protein D3C80_2127350 [compost metagenome]
MPDLVIDADLAQHGGAGQRVQAQLLGLQRGQRLGLVAELLLQVDHRDIHGQRGAD